MTTPWSGAALAEAIEAFAPGSTEKSHGGDVWLKPEAPRVQVRSPEQRHGGRLHRSF